MLQGIIVYTYTFDENRRAEGMLKAIRDQAEGKYRGGGRGNKSLITACPQAG